MPIFFHSLLVRFVIWKEKRQSCLFSFQITNLTKSEWKKMGNSSEFHSERNYYLQNWYFRNFYIFFLVLYYVTFQCGRCNIFKKFQFFPTKSWKNHPKKLHTYGSWKVFFSAAPTAQNSPELHFRFINSFTWLSRVGSLITIFWTTRLFYEPPKQCIWRLSCTRFRTTRVNNHEQNRVIMGSEKRLLTYLICATWAVLRQRNLMRY